MFPKPFKQFGDLLNWEKLFILRGKVEESFDVFAPSPLKNWAVSNK